MTEELEDYRCSKYKEKVSSMKTFTVDSLPNVLTLPLKRFESNGDKVSKNFPENINIRPFTSEPAGDPQNYSLYAVLVHSGSTSSEGHYFCYVKASSGQWYKMDDSSVSVRNIKQVLKRKAYILFYIRSDLKSDSATKIEPEKTKRKRKRSENKEHPLVTYYHQLTAERMSEIKRDTVALIWKTQNWTFLLKKGSAQTITASRDHRLILNPFKDVGLPL